MATITGTHVNFVKVPSMAKFNDITTKVDGTVYFIVDAKKIYLDGVMYGFNDSDIDLTPFLKHDGTVKLTGHLNFNGFEAYNVDSIQSRKGYNNDYGILLDDGLATIKTLDEDHSYDGEWAEAIFSPSGLEFYSGLERKATIKGLSFIDEATIDALEEFENMDPTQAVPYGTLQNMKGGVFGFAELDGMGKVPAAQLPSFVDDIIEVNNYNSLPTTGEKGKLYVTIDNNHLYRWSGSAWVNVSDGNAHLQLGTTSSTAYRGDHGLAAYNHISKTDNPHSVTKTQVGLGSVQNYGKATKAEAEAGTSDAKYMTPLRTKEAIEKLAPKLAWTVVA